jgi:hypothetical protein
MSVWDFGDYHRNATGEKEFLELDIFPEQEFLNKEDVLIVNGDTGLLSFKDIPGYNKVKKEQEWFASKNYTTLCVMGNHENWDVYDNLPIVNKWGAEVKMLETDFGPLYFTITGEVYTIDNKTFFVVNGALSIDKGLRTAGHDWFEQEGISYADTYKVIDKANEIKKVDFLLTHTINSDLVRHFTASGTDYHHIKYKCHTSEFLAHLDTLLEYKENLFGHFHIQKSITVSNKIYSCFFKTKPRKL